MRTKPYTAIGIKKVKCFRCNNKADYQWQICSDNNVYRPLCVYCDIELNELVLKFMKFKDAKQKIERYRELKLKAL